MGGRLAAALALGLAACGVPDPAPSEDVGPALAARALTYNVAQVDGGARGDQVAAVIAAAAPELVALQECLGCEALAAALGLALAAPPASGVAILFDPARFRLAEADVIELGVDDDGWGRRVAAVARLEDVATERVLVAYSAHFCVPIRTPDDACDEARQLDYVDAILADLAGRGPGPALIAGDLNVFDGFADGAVIEGLEASGFVDLYRAAAPDADDLTFQGNTWAPPGRIDYVFARDPADAIEASVRRDSPADEASDHFAVAAAVRFPAAPVAD